MHLLVAEDDRRLARVMQRVLREEGHAVDVAHDGDDAYGLATEGGFDVLVLDVMMPGRDGFRLVRDLRAAGVGTPVLFLTARGELADRVRGLDSGGDDYLVKPFAFDELLARVRALGRRPEGRIEDRLLAGDIELDVPAHRVMRGGRAIELTATEFRLLEALARHPGQVLTRAALLARVWGYEDERTENSVDLYVHYLRRKLGPPDPIETVRGVGYTLAGAP